MRPLFALILLAGFGIQASAGCENSTLVVHSALHVPIKVYVDGTTGNNPPTVGVTVHGVTPGRHHLKVVEVYVDDYGYTQRKTIYNGNIDVRSSMHMDARVDDGRGVAIHDTYVPCGSEYNGQGNGNYQGGDNNDRRYDNNNSDANNNSYNPAPAAPATPALPAHMTDDDFYQLKSTIGASQYETKKLDTLKTVIGTSKLSTSQVSDLMGLFSFESNKLEVAKLLYDHVVDKQNYASLSSNFNFDARKEEFKKFLAGK